MSLSESLCAKFRLFYVSSVLWWSVSLLVLRALCETKKYKEEKDRHVSLGFGVVQREPSSLDCKFGASGMSESVIHHFSAECS